ALGMSTTSFAQNTIQHYKTLPLKQSLTAEFALSYDQPEIAVHNYKQLALHSESTIAKQRALDVALEANNFNAALAIAMH
ncbi:hypothetical protein ABFV54_28375, partial [Pseudomonas syringae]